MEMIEATQANWDEHVKFLRNTSVLRDNIAFSERKLTISHIKFPDIFKIDFQENISISEYEFIGCNFECFYSGISGEWSFGNVKVTLSKCSLDTYATDGNNIGLSISFVESIRVKNVNMLSDFTSVEVVGDINVFTNLTKLEVRGARNLDKAKLSKIKINQCNFDEVEINSINNLEFTAENVICRKSLFRGILSSNVSITMFSKVDSFIIYKFAGSINLRESTFKDIDISIDKQKDISNIQFFNVVADNVTFNREFSVPKREVIIDTIIISQGNIGNILFGEVVCKQIILSMLVASSVILPIKLTKFDSFKLSGSSQNKSFIDRIFIIGGNFLEGATGDKPSITMEHLETSSLVFHSFYNNSNVYISNLSWGLTNDAIKAKPMPNTIWAAVVGQDIPINQFVEEKDDNGLIKAIFERGKPIEENILRGTMWHNWRKYLRPLDANQLVIVQSDLGKINLISCDFSDMQLKFSGSKITELFLSGTEMPKTAIGEYKDKQVAYAQLKKVYDNRGDSVSSNDYQAKELEAHFDYLKHKKRDGEERRDYFTLWLNKYSNKFNQSYTRTLKYGLPVMGLIYWVYCLSLGFRLFTGADSYDWGIFKHLVSLFPEFIYPIHTAGFVPKEMGLTTTFLIAPTVEFIARAVNGYLFFQFIQAFRKFGKK
ncbi:hypothetical protein [Dyadobacter psychrotolerans]|uniref:Uncharacterized protein n=1 Tax=Dyadobacter psychrotolerans TaxID=2541721 RepID=A0A4R5DB11_9BACT|nr:hypothetical protein [Dyadobacter psychrotolerans]TDE10819.1 hypothetical protein E0F88_27485 [Dyadobacter psychrotolerans]